jgi:hypothetical protein
VTYFVPGSQEKDPAKVIMSLQQAHEKTATNTTDITALTAVVATKGPGTITNVATAGLATGGPITSTGTVTVTGASQSDQETGSSTSVVVTPGVQKFHPSSAKAWVKWTGSTGAILASYNVTSVTRSLAGVYVVNFTTAFSSANYGVAASCEGTGAAAGLFAVVTNTTPATGSCGITTLNTTFSAADPTSGYAVFYGDQ